jgi:hypothetical protein
MYVNAKMIPVETVQGVRGEGVKESSKGDDSNLIYLVHCKNFCECYNVPPSSTTMIKINK